MTFTLTTRHVDGGTVLGVHGELDVHTRRQLARAAEHVVAGTDPRLVVDLSCATFMDCSGLAELLALHKSMARRGAELRLVGATGTVRKLLRVTGVGGYLDAKPGTGPGAAAAEPS